MGRDILRKIEGRELSADKPTAFISGHPFPIHPEDADKIKRLIDEGELREVIYHSNKKTLNEDQLNEFYSPDNLTFNEYGKIKGMKGEEKYKKKRFNS